MNNNFHSIFLQKKKRKLLILTTKYELKLESRNEYREEIHEEGYGFESQIELEEETLSAKDEKQINESAMAKNRAWKFLQKNLEAMVLKV